MLAVVDDHSEAERAVQALKDAGVRDGDVDVMEGAWFAEAVRGIERRGGLAARLAKILPTDEQLMLRRYMAKPNRVTRWSWCTRKARKMWNVRGR